MTHGAGGPASILAVGLAGALLAASSALAQDDEFDDCVFVDGECIEGYVYVPEFMSPQALKSLIEAESGDIVIVDTAAELIFEDERIPGSVNFPWVHELSLPVTLPRDKTLVIYCACNDHEDSVDMAQKLGLVGYLDIKVLEGGWFEWLDLGYETVGLAVEEIQ